MQLFYTISTKVSPILNFLRISCKTFYFALIGKATQAGLSSPDAVNFDKIPLETDLSVITPNMVLTSTETLTNSPGFLGFQTIKVLASTGFWFIWDFLTRIPYLMMKGGFLAYKGLENFILMTPFGIFYVVTIAIFIISTIWTKGELLTIIYVLIARSFNAFIACFGFLASKILQKNLDFWGWIGTKCWLWFEAKFSYLAWALKKLWFGFVKIWKIVVGSFYFFRDLKNIFTYVVLGNKVINTEDGIQPVSFFTRVKEIKTIYKGLHDDLDNEASLLIFNRFRAQMYFLSGQINPLFYPELDGLNLTENQIKEFMLIPEDKKIEHFFHELLVTKNNLEKLKNEQSQLLIDNNVLIEQIKSRFGVGYLDSNIRQKSTIFQRFVDDYLVQNLDNPRQSYSYAERIRPEQSMKFLGESKYEINGFLINIHEQIEEYEKIVKKMKQLPNALTSFELERHENSYQFLLTLSRHGEKEFERLCELPENSLDEIKVCIKETVLLQNELESVKRSLVFANSHLNKCYLEMEQIIQFNDLNTKIQSLNDLYARMSSPFDVYVLYTDREKNGFLSQLVVNKKVKLSHNFDTFEHWVPSLFKNNLEVPRTLSSQQSLSSFSSNLSNPSFHPDGKFITISENSRSVIPSNVADLVEYCAAIPFLRFALPMLKNL